MSIRIKCGRCRLTIVYSVISNIVWMIRLYLYYLVNRAQLREHCRGRSSVSTTASPVSDNGNPPIGSMPAVDGGMTTDNVECPAFHLQAPGKLVRRLGRLCYELDKLCLLIFSFTISLLIRSNRPGPELVSFKFNVVRLCPRSFPI
jgi:hypothetical protein